MAENQTTSQPKRRSLFQRTVRRALKLAILLVILVGLLLLAVQVVLWTTLPRKWVLDAIQEKLQLRVGAQDFSTGWRGRTALSNVTLGLPLADESFLQSGALRVKHTSLLGLLTGQPLRVESIEIDRPHLLVRQSANGQWNLQEVADLMSRAGGRKAVESESAPDPAPDLPAVTIRDATVRIIDMRGTQVTLAPLNIIGRPRGPLVWEYEVNLPDRVWAKGVVAPGESWKHELAMTIGNLGPTFKPLIDNAPAALRDAVNTFELKANWAGNVKDGVLGRLDVKHLAMSGNRVAGPARMSFAGGKTTLEPVGLRITPANVTLAPFVLTGGELALDDVNIDAKSVTAAFSGGDVRVSGRYTPASGGGDVELAWNRLMIASDMINSGTLKASVRQPWPGQPSIEGSLNLVGERARQRWNARLTLNGSGASWGAVNWTLNAPQLTYTNEQQTWNLGGLWASLQTRGDVIALTRVVVPPGLLYKNFQRGTTDAGGEYNLKTGNWFVWASGERWPIQPYLGDPATFTIRVNADRTWLNLDEFYAQAGELKIWLQGALSYRAKGLPVDAHLYAWHPPLGTGKKSSEIEGLLVSQTHLTRTLDPIDLDINGRLIGRKMSLKGRKLGDLTLHYQGKADPHKAKIASTQFRMFNGNWALAARYDYASRDVGVVVDAAEVPLREMDDFISPPPDLRGTLSGHWEVSLPASDMKRLDVSGTYRAEKIARVTERKKQPGKVDEITMPIVDWVEGKILTKNGYITLDEMKLAQKNGRGEASLWFALEEPSKLFLTTNFAAWPVEFSTERSDAAPLLGWLASNIEVDLKNKTASGGLGGRALLTLKDQDVLNANFDATVDGRKIDVDRFSGDLLGGAVTGQGRIDLEKPFDSRGRVEVANFSPARLKPFSPMLAEIEGTYTTVVAVAPSPRDPSNPVSGPMEIRGKVNASSGRYRGLSIGDMDFVAYGDWQRAVLQRLTCKLADGKLDGWARYSNYDNDRFLHTRLDFVQLSLNQLVEAWTPPGKPREDMPGRLTGQMFAAGNPFTPQGRRALTGEANVQIQESDLANVDVVTVLYNLMSVKGGVKEPTGRGRATARLEGPRVEVPRIKYFNRGADLWANVTVMDIFKGVESPIEGIAAGSARPLRDLKLPFMADVDKIMQSLQGSLATAKIGGTIGEPQVKVVPFSESGESFRRFMVGEVKEQTRGRAGQ